MFSTTFWDLQKCFCVFRSNCQISLWTLTNCFLRFVTINDEGKNGPKTFVIVKTAFFEIFFFYRLLRYQRRDLIICTISVKLPHVPWQVVHWRLSCSIKWEKLGQTLFFTGKIAFSSKTSVFNSLLVLKEMILSLPQKLSKCLLDPYKLLLDVSPVR